MTSRGDKSQRATRKLRNIIKTSCKLTFPADSNQYVNPVGVTCTWPFSRTFSFALSWLKTYGEEFLVADEETFSCSWFWLNGWCKWLSSVHKTIPRAFLVCAGDCHTSHSNTPLRLTTSEREIGNRRGALRTEVFPFLFKHLVKP